MKLNKKPNILFFFSDQQRPDTIGCYGQKLDVTPNLDKLAKTGIKFERAYSCQPVCGPARACIQTGKYASEMGTFRNSIGLPRNEKTMAHYLSKAGYEVGYIGKWHLATTLEIPGKKDIDYKDKPVPPAYRGGYKDYWLASDVMEKTSDGHGGYLFDGNMKKVEFKGYRVDRITDFVLEYLKNRKSNKPFFLFVSYLEPHHQNNHNRYEGPAGSKKKFRNFVIPKDLEGTGGDWKWNYPDYLGCCNSLDKNLGRIIGELEKQGQRENTAIVYTTDHGCHFRTRNSNQKCSCHDSSIHIPLVINAPGFKGNTKVKELVSLIDIAPTVLDIAGVKKPSPMKGASLRKLVSGSKKNWRKEVFVQICETEVGRAIRTDRWTYSVAAPKLDGWDYASSDVYVEEYLYDNVKDPFQKVNLVYDPAFKVLRSKLSKILIKYMKKAGEKEPEIFPG